MRLLNHWGYDAANYDSDAIILKNPEVLFYEEFSDSHLVASRGRFPDSANEKFGLTMCAGMFMIKSSPETGTFVCLSVCAYINTYICHHNQRRHAFYTAL